MKLPPNLTQLQHQLRKGVHPDDMGLRELGEGAQKTAYRFDTKYGSYAVKKQTGGWQDENQTRPPKADVAGYDEIYQIRAGVWIIQEMAVRILAEIDPHENARAWNAYRQIRRTCIGDLHTHNFGTRKDGTLICFDW
jgi:hypothetical protein